LLAFMRAAFKVFVRDSLKPAKTKRTGKAKGRATSGGPIAKGARIENKRTAKKQARIAGLKHRAKKIEPKRPGSPQGPKPKPT
jgi:hypothetical protein